MRSPPLVIVVTALAAFASAAAVNGKGSITAADQRWIAATMAIWAPAVLLVVSSPVHWLASLLRADGAAHTAVERDIELTHLERVTGRIGSVAWVASYAAAIVLLVEYPVSSQWWSEAGSVVTEAQARFDVDAQVLRVLILDGQGNRNRFDFSKPQVNLALPPGQFQFTPPPGTTIVKP